MMISMGSALSMVTLAKTGWALELEDELACAGVREDCEVRDG